MRQFAVNVISAVFVAVLAVETVIDRHTGVTLPALRKQRERRGRHLQRRLNAEHGTAIEYGYIHA